MSNLRRFDYLYFSGMSAFCASLPYLSTAQLQGPGSGVNWIQPYWLRLGIIFILPIILVIISLICLFYRRRNLSRWAAIITIMISTVVILYELAVFGWIWLLNHTRLHI
jgi:hypothetical protein